MNGVKSILEQHTAGAQAIGFDYQFYYFMFLALNLKFGQKVGFEVKDDVHIDNDDGTSILLQTKHSVVVNAEGVTQNLTALDSDLWKTLNNWVSFIKADKANTGFLAKYSFILVTNKNDQNNDFIKCLDSFKSDGDAGKMLTKLKELEEITQDETLKKYIKNISSLGKKKMKEFFLKVTIETGIDEIIQKIKNRIFENVRQKKFIDPIFESLSSNLQVAKYTEIKGRNKFEITFDDFNKKFGKCFQVAVEANILPQRNLPILLPGNLEDQTFVKQLIDIGEVESGSTSIRDYTTQMLKFLNDFTYWSEESFLLPSDIERFKENSIRLWINEFRVKYRMIERRLQTGISLDDLEEDIKELGIGLIDYIRKQDLIIRGFTHLGIESSNGHYYALSDNIEIGWHFDWKNKYKK